MYFDPFSLEEYKIAEKYKLQKFAPLVRVQNKYLEHQQFDFNRHSDIRYFGVLADCVHFAQNELYNE